MAGMRARNIILSAVLSVTMGAFSISAFAQAGADSQASSSSFIVSGKVVDCPGAPMGGVTVKVGLWGLRDGDCVTTSKEDGTFRIDCRLPAGDLQVKFEKPGCSTVVRKVPGAIRMEERKPWTIVMLCSDPPPPIKPHKKRPGIGYEAYVGHYRMVSICADGGRTDTEVHLSAISPTDRRKCLCRKGWRLAVVGADSKRESYGCWWVKPDGDIEVSFPCDGAAFGGSTWTLWKNGDSLVGQGSSWSDAGVGAYWEMTLTPMQRETDRDRPSQERGKSLPKRASSNGEATMKGRGT